MIDSTVHAVRFKLGSIKGSKKSGVPIFGCESIVSEVLHKKRDLNKTHIKKLSKRFNVSPAVFF